MRDYGKVSPQFWIGTTGKALRGDVEAQLVALYLMTSPHATMIGVYHLPILYLAHETGLTVEGASKGLARCIEADFCTYDEASETVFVHHMARHQIGDDLKPGDKRLAGVRKQFEQLPAGRIRAAFQAIYADAYGLPKEAEKARGSQGAPKPLPSQEQEQEQKQEQERGSPSGSRLPADWKLPADWWEWARRERPDVDPGLESAKFADFWHAKAGKDGRKADWQATWRNWIRNSRGNGATPTTGAARKRVEL